MTSGKRSMRLTLVAMTLANSMILVDQTAVPLATRTSSTTSPRHSTFRSGF